MRSATLAQKRPLPSSIFAVGSDADTTIQIVVEVREGATVYVNDKLTKSTGTTRQFLSSDLQRGKSYKFRVRAELMGADGNLISETQQVSMATGESHTMKFVLVDRKSQYVATARRAGDTSTFLSP